MADSPARYPLVLTRPAGLGLVVGGGPVGRRKAAGLVAGGLAARVVCPHPPPADWPVPPGSDWREAAFEPAHLAGACLAFACATPPVNAAVAEAARAAGVPVCRADDPAGGDFVVPAVVRAGPLLVAVSLGGAAPALARRVRERLEQTFDAAFAEWAELLGELRPLVLARVADPEARRRLLDAWADWPWLERLRAEGVAAVRAAYLAELASTPPAPSPRAW